MLYYTLLHIKITIFTGLYLVEQELCEMGVCGQTRRDLRFKQFLLQISTPISILNGFFTGWCLVQRIKVVTDRPMYRPKKAAHFGSFSSEILFRNKKLVLLHGSTNHCHTLRYDTFLPIKLLCKRYVIAWFSAQLAFTWTLQDCWHSL